MVFILLLFCSFNSFAQDTIKFEKDEFSKNGFTFCSDENCLSVNVETKVKIGKYVLLVNNKILAQINKISKDINLTYYYSGNIVQKITFYPYLTLELNFFNNRYSIYNIDFYKNFSRLKFTEANNNFDIEVFTKKKRIEIHNLEILVY